MNWLDLVFGLILAGSVISGLRRGFARIGIGLAATILAFLLGAWFYVEAGTLFLDYTSSPGVAHFLGFNLIFFGVLLAGALLGHAATALFKWIGLSWANRLMGGAVGAAQGVLMALVVLMAVNAFLPGDPPRAVLRSRIAPYLLESSNVLTALTPPTLRAEFRKNYAKVKQAWIDPFEQRLRRME